MTQNPAARIIWKICTIILVCLASFCNADEAIHKSNEGVCNDRQLPANNLLPLDSTENRQCSESKRDKIGTKTKLEQPRIGNSTTKFLTEEEHIAAYRWSQQNQFKVYPSKLQNMQTSSDEIDVTLVTQLSLDRLSVFEQLCQRWTGPISAAIYVPETSMNHFNKYIKESRIFSTRQNIGCQIVKAEGEFYPINYLRNVALQNSQTNYNFLNDVDFIPTTNLYENIRGKIATYLQQPAKEDKNKTCLVIPAFEMETESKEFNTKCPNTKRKLLNKLKAGEVIQFHKRKFETGHQPTNYQKWIKSHSPYYVNWKPLYEPYIVIDKNAPKYDQRFVGYGWNKISQILEVAASGYKFLVMHDSFIVHMPHPKSKDSIRMKNKQYRSILHKTISLFLTDFVQKYGNASSEMVKQILHK